MKPICSEDGCPKPVMATGLCSMHYTRQYRHGSLADPRAPVPCIECGEPGKPQTRLCARCYRRLYMRKRRQEPAIREKESAVREARRDEINAAARRNYYANIERRREQSRKNARAYRERYPERSRETDRRVKAKYGRNYKGKRRALENAGHVPAEVMAALQRAKKCAACGCWLTRKPGPRQLHVDHIVPLNAGGTHTPENLRPVCRTCNVRRPKNGRDVPHMQLPMVWSLPA